MHAIWLMALKDLRLLLRDRAGFFFAFIFPLIYATFFGMIFSRSGGDSAGIAVAVVDEDGTAESQRFVDELAANKAFSVTRRPREQALGDVRRGAVTAMVALPPGFGAAQNSMFNLFSGNGPHIQIAVDPARQAESAMLEGLLTQQSFMRLAHGFAKPRDMLGDFDQWMRDWRDDSPEAAGWQTALGSLRGALELIADQSERGDAVAESQSRPTSTPAATARGTKDDSDADALAMMQPIRFDKIDVVQKRGGPTNAFAITIPQGIIWAVMGCAAGFGLSLVQERSSGTLVRLRMAPIDRGQILGGKALACLLTVLGVSVFMLLFAMVVFGVRPTGPLLLVPAFASVAICFCGVMLLLSVLGRTERAASGICWAALMIFAMIGGGMVPLFFMPTWMQTLGTISPVRWSILAMEGAIWREFTPLEMLLPCGVLIAMGAASFLVGVARFRWSE